MRYPDPEQVLDHLGDKVAEAAHDAVEFGRSALAEYRTAMPDAAARATNRTLACVIHDATWDYVTRELDGLAEVSFVDRLPTRDMYVTRASHVYRIRFKRHSRSGRIASYPTPSALEFIAQPENLFQELGIVEVNLSIGYEWDHMARAMGEVVMSLRDGSFEETEWMVHLPGRSGGTSGTVAPLTPITPVGDSPRTPVIEVTRDANIDEGSGTE